MTTTPARVGSYAWTLETGGCLTSSERRQMWGPIARTHAVNALGRMAMLARVNSGRRATLDPASLGTPVSVLTRAAESSARQRLTPVLLGHAYRTYTFGRALGVLENVEVDTELLFAAAMLHDVGLIGPRQPVDFTVASARVARDVAEQVGLSGAATETMCTAITMHHSPGVSVDDGPVAYLLSAGAGVDVMGLNAWKLPPALLEITERVQPRLRFKREFADLWRAEAAAVPAGRARLLQRFAAFGLAIRLAPFRD